MLFSHWYNPFRDITRSAIIRKLRKNPGAYYFWSGVNPGYLMLENGELVRYGSDIFAGPRTDKMKGWFDKSLLCLFSGESLSITNANIDQVFKELTTHAQNMPSDVWLPVINNHHRLWGVKAYDLRDYACMTRWSQLDAQNQPVGEDQYIPRARLTPIFYRNLSYLHDCVMRAKNFSKWDHVTQSALPLALPNWLRVQETSESDAALQCVARLANGHPLPAGESIRAKFDVMLDPSYLDTLPWLEIDLFDTLETVMEQLVAYYPEYDFSPAVFNLSTVQCLTKDQHVALEPLCLTDYSARIQCRSVPDSKINCI